MSSQAPTRSRRALALLLPEDQNAYDVLEALKARCARRGVVRAEADGACVFRTASDLAARLRPGQAPPRRLPRPEIEAVRGVSPGPASVDVLLDAGLIQPVGRREVPGRLRCGRRRRVTWPGSACAACATCRALACRCRRRPAGQARSQCRRGRCRLVWLFPQPWCGLTGLRVHQGQASSLNAIIAVLAGARATRATGEKENTGAHGGVGR